MMKGFQLGTYVLEEKLGEGGMAEVWRAAQPPAEYLCGGEVFWCRNWQEIRTSKSAFWGRGNGRRRCSIRTSFPPSIFITSITAVIW